MKWYKHYSNMRLDVKIKRLIKQYGIEGYGLYNYILETIAFNLNPEKPIPAIEENYIDIAEDIKMESTKVEDIILFCIKQGLFEIDENTQQLMCFKLLKHLDNTLSSNPEIKKILNNFDNLKKLEETSSDLKQIRLDKIRIDKNRLEEEYINKTPSTSQSQSPSKIEKLNKQKQRMKDSSITENSYNNIKYLSILEYWNETADRVNSKAEFKKMSKLDLSRDNNKTVQTILNHLRELEDGQFIQLNKVKYATPTKKDEPLTMDEMTKIIDDYSLLFTGDYTIWNGKWDFDKMMTEFKGLILNYNTKISIFYEIYIHGVKKYEKKESIAKPNPMSIDIILQRCCELDKDGYDKRDNEPIHYNQWLEGMKNSDETISWYNKGLKFMSQKLSPCYSRVNSDIKSQLLDNWGLDSDFPYPELLIYFDFLKWEYIDDSDIDIFFNSWDISNTIFDNQNMQKNWNKWCGKNNLSEFKDFWE